MIGFVIFSFFVRTVLLKHTPNFINAPTKKCDFGNSGDAIFFDENRCLAVFKHPKITFYEANNLCLDQGQSLLIVEKNIEFFKPKIQDSILSECEYEIIVDNYEKKHLENALPTYVDGTDEGRLRNEEFEKNCFSLKFFSSSISSHQYDCNVPKKCFACQKNFDQVHVKPAENSIRKNIFQEEETPSTNATSFLFTTGGHHIVSFGIPILLFILLNPISFLIVFLIVFSVVQARWSTVKVKNGKKPLLFFMQKEKWSQKKILKFLIIIAIGIVLMPVVLYFTMLVLLIGIMLILMILSFTPIFLLFVGILIVVIIFGTAAGWSIWRGSFKEKIIKRLTPKCSYTQYFFFCSCYGISLFVCVLSSILFVLFIVYLIVFAAAYPQEWVSMWPMYDIKPSAYSIYGHEYYEYMFSVWTYIAMLAIPLLSLLPFVVISCIYCGCNSLWYACWSNFCVFQKKKYTGESVEYVNKYIEELKASQPVLDAKLVIKCFHYEKKNAFDDENQYLKEIVTYNCEEKFSFSHFADVTRFPDYEQLPKFLRLKTEWKIAHDHSTLQQLELLKQNAYNTHRHRDKHISITYIPPGKSGEVKLKNNLLFSSTGEIPAELKYLDKNRCGVFGIIRWLFGLTILDNYEFFENFVDFNLQVVKVLGFVPNMDMTSLSLVIAPEKKNGGILGVKDLLKFSSNNVKQTKIDPKRIINNNNSNINGTTQVSDVEMKEIGIIKKQQENPVVLKPIEESNKNKDDKPLYIAESPSGRRKEMIPKEVENVGKERNENKSAPVEYNSGPGMMNIVNTEVNIVRDEKEVDDNVKDVESDGKRDDSSGEVKEEVKREEVRERNVEVEKEIKDNKANVEEEKGEQKQEMEEIEEFKKIEEELNERIEVKTEKKEEEVKEEVKKDEVKREEVKIEVKREEEKEEMEMGDVVEREMREVRKKKKKKKKKKLDGSLKEEKKKKKIELIKLKHASIGARNMIKTGSVSDNQILQCFPVLSPNILNDLKNSIVEEDKRKLLKKSAKESVIKMIRINDKLSDSQLIECFSSLNQEDIDEVREKIKKEKEKNESKEKALKVLNVGVLNDEQILNCFPLLNQNDLNELRQKIVVNKESEKNDNEKEEQSEEEEGESEGEEGESEGESESEEEKK